MRESTRNAGDSSAALQRKGENKIKMSKKARKRRQEVEKAKTEDKVEEAHTAPQRTRTR